VIVEVLRSQNKRFAGSIASMSAQEVEGSFAIIRRDSRAALAPFLSGL
jgi:hypothetical protein